MYVFSDPEEAASDRGKEAKPVVSQPLLIFGTSTALYRLASPSLYFSVPILVLLPPVKYKPDTTVPGKSATIPI